MATTLGAAMKKECRKLIKSSFSTFPHGLVSFEPLNDISHTEVRSEKAWLQVALNALTGNLSDGFSGMGGPKLLKNVINGFKKPIQRK